jgi:hypothetical protein
MLYSLFDLEDCERHGNGTDSLACAKLPIYLLLAQNNFRLPRNSSS